MANADFVIYTLGDTDTFEAMLQGVALIFQDPLLSGSGAFGLGYGVLVGVFLLFTIALYQSVFTQKFEYKMLIAPFFFYVALTLPKTTVTVVDVYNQAPTKQVANIPLGLALPLNLASSISYGFTESMEKAYSTPNSPRLLTDGFASPLKTLYALRYVNISEESPYISNMINQVYQSCIVGNSKFDPDEYKNSPDAYTYFINFLYTNSSGIVTLRNIDGTFETFSCYEAANKLQTSFESFVYGNGATSGTLNYNFKRALNGALLLSDSSNSLTKSRDYNDVMNSFAQITDLTAQDGRQFLLNTLFNQPLQSASFCANNQGSTESTSTNMAHCTSWVQSEAQLAEDNAAAATGFLRMMQDGQNVLLFLAILLFPFVVVLIVYMGTKSVVIIASYITYLASVYLWMPVASIINFYSYIRITDTIYTFSGSNTGSLFGISDYPAFYEAIADSLSLANGLTAIIPIFSMMFFSGLTMAVVGFMRRSDVTQTPYYDAKQNVPDALSGSPFANKTSMTTSNGLGAVTDSNGGKAFTTSSSQSFEATGSQMVALQKKKSILESRSQSLTAQINDLSSVSSSGGTTENHLSNVRDHSRKEIISGTGYNQQYSEADSASYTQNGKRIQLKSDESDVVTATNQVGVNTGAGIGLKAGKGTTFADTTLAADGTPAALQNASTEQTAAKGSGDNAYSLAFIQVKAGSATIAQAGYQDADRGVVSGTEKNTIYKGSGSEQKDYAESHYRLTGGYQDNRVLDGKSHGLDKNVSVASNETTKQSQEYKASLTQALSQTQAELEQVNNAISRIAASSFTVNMLDSDVMHRITRHESVREDLERIDQQNKERFGEKWEEAKRIAAAHAQVTELAVSQFANPEQFAYYTIAMAGMSMNYESSSATYKALTGFDAPDHDLNSNLRSANTDWSNMNLDHRDLAGNYAKYFGSNSNLDGQYAYLAGELEVRGDKQQQNMIMVYNSFLHAGFTPKQAAILTAEVGRENSFNSASLFGTHYDPEKKHLTNGGMISFNQDRKEDLDREMMAKGLVTRGKIGSASYLESQASLDAMAQFMHKELSTNSRYSIAWAALNSETKSIDEIHYAVGKNYIVWRIDDEKYRENGERNRKEFAERLNNELISQSKAKFEPNPIGQMTSADFASANNPSLISALSKTGLKGQILGNGLVDNKFIANTGLPIKTPSHNKDQAYGGGQSRGYTVEFAHLTNQQLGGKIKYFSGFNDEYHQSVGSTGKHVQGKAFDLVLNNPNDAKKAIAEMQELAKKHGYKVAFVNEYEGKSKDFTGQHLHVSVLGREGGYQNKISKEIDERQIAAASSLNKADLTRTQIARPVKKDVGSFIPQGHGADHHGPSVAELTSRHAKNTHETQQQFNRNTLFTHGISVTPDKNGEDLHYSVGDKGKLAENLNAPVVSGDIAAKMVKENILNTIERNKTMPANFHLDQAMSKTDEKTTPQYSDFNLSRQKHVEKARQENDQKLTENTGLNRLEVGQDRRKIEENNDLSREDLQKGLNEKTQQEKERRFKVIQDELRDNPVPREQHGPASLNSALVGKSYKPDPSSSILTADNITMIEALQRYNAKRDAKDKE